MDSVLHLCFHLATLFTMSYQMARIDPCIIPAILTTECTDDKARFYYDYDGKQCKKFEEGSCGSNINKFITEEECESTCNGAKDGENNPVKGVDHDKSLKEDDKNPVKEGDDKSVNERDANKAVKEDDENKSVKKDANDKHRRMKRQFIPTKEERDCSLPYDDGRCLIMFRSWTHGVPFRRYYYDSANNECRILGLFRCGGNGNNFGSLKECKEFCEKEEMEAADDAQQKKSEKGKSKKG